MPPEPPNARIFQHAQQLRLRADRHLGEFVQQQSAVLRQFEAARAALHRARERALLVSEELAFHQRLRHGGAVDRDERPAAAWAQVMDGAGNQFLARAAFAGHQHAALLGATCRISEKTCCIRADWPTRSTSTP